MAPGGMTDSLIQVFHRLSGAVLLGAPLFWLAYHQWERIPQPGRWIRLGVFPVARARRSAHSTDTQNADSFYRKLERVVLLLYYGDRAG
jgi:hypothetical protein